VLAVGFVFVKVLVVRGRETGAQQGLRCGRSPTEPPP